MKRNLRRWLLGCVVALVAAGAASEIWPEHTARIMLSGLNVSAGLQRAFVETSIGSVHYLEGGAGETVVFLHGIFALKEHWIDMSRQISGDYHVILLDLPGFGENARLDAVEYDYARQTANVLEALDEIGVAEFHIVANSMGAQIAAHLSIELTDRVKSVAFIGSPVGISSPIPSHMERAISEGKRPLVVTTEAEYAERMAWLFPEAPFIPRPVARTWAANEVSHADINPVIWEAVNSSTTPTLEELAPMLQQPSLVVWCREDRIFHVSGAEVLDSTLPNSTLIVADGCGHLPMLDQPVRTAQHYRRFLVSLEGL